MKNTYRALAFGMMLAVFDMLKVQPPWGADYFMSREKQCLCGGAIQLSEETFPTYSRSVLL